MQHIQVLAHTLRCWSLLTPGMVLCCVLEGSFQLFCVIGQEYLVKVKAGENYPVAPEWEPGSGVALGLDQQIKQLPCTLGFPNGHFCLLIDFWNSDTQPGSNIQLHNSVAAAAILLWALVQEFWLYTHSDYTHTDLKAMNFGRNCLKPLLWP